MVLHRDWVKSIRFESEKLSLAAPFIGQFGPRSILWITLITITCPGICFCAWRILPLYKWSTLFSPVYTRMTECSPGSEGGWDWGGGGGGSEQSVHVLENGGHEICWWPGPHGLGRRDPEALLWQKRLCPNGSWARGLPVVATWTSVGCMAPRCHLLRRCWDSPGGGSCPRGLQSPTVNEGSISEHNLIATDTKTVPHYKPCPTIKSLTRTKVDSD